jgi:predicted amidohydrolase
MLKMRTGFLQYDVVFGDKEANQRKILSLIGGDRFDLLVLPELALTGYFMPSRAKTVELAEEFASGETFEFFRDAAHRQDGAIVFGFAERAGDKVYNSAALLCPDGTAYLYRKTHLFNLEKQWFDPGDTGFRVFEFRGARIGIMICFDWLFPESARTLMLRGADIICHPSNLVLPYCQDPMITRCLENRVYAITCNRTGMERQGDEMLAFTGRSQIVGPRGELLASSDGTGEKLVLLDLDPALARDKTVTAYNNLLDDRRNDSYYF